MKGSPAIRQDFFCVLSKIKSIEKSMLFILSFYFFPLSRDRNIKKKVRGIFLPDFLFYTTP